MFNATNARTQSIDNQTVETEILLLNLNIMKAVNSNNVTTVLSGNTVTQVSSANITGSPMTLDPNYYNSWQTITANNVCAGQMQSVLDNFNTLGYTISRQSYDGTHIYWQISW